MKFSRLVLAALALGCAQEPRPVPPDPAPLTVQASPAVEVVVPLSTPVLGTTGAPGNAVLATRLMARVRAVAVAEGDMVRRGQVLVTLEDGDLRARLDQARAGLREAEALFEQAGREAERRRQLHRDEALPQEGLDQAQTQETRAQSARQAAAAAVAQAEAELAYTQIRSPLDGVVVQRHIQPGDLSAPGAPLLTVESRDPLEVVAAVGERLFTSLATGQEVEVEIPALSQTLRGKVSALVPALEARSRTFRVKVALPNPDLSLGSGLYARVLVPTGERSALLVPAAALVREGQLEGVYVAEAGRARLRWLRLGQSRGDQREVLSGLTAGQQVICPPPPGLRDGQVVEVR